MRMNVIKRLARRLLIIVILLSFLPLIGCTIPVVNKKICLPPQIPLIGGNCQDDPDPEPTEEITLTYWGLWEDKENLLPLIEDYQAEHPNITVHYQERTFENYFETIQARIVTDLAPDIIRVHNTWVPYLGDDLSALPEDIMTPSAYEQTFYPVTQESLLVDGAYRAIPLEIDGLALLYNRTLFNQEGLTKPPSTWDEFKETAAQLTKENEEGKITQSGVAMGYADSIEHFSDLLGLLMAQNFKVGSGKVEFVDEEGNIVFDEKITDLGDNLGAEAVEYYTHFASTDRSWNPEWDSAIRSFAEGKVAMIFAPSFRIFDILGINPNLNIGVTKVPQLTTNPADQVNWASYWVEAVPAKSPHPREAWKFLKFLSEKENLKKLYSLASNKRPFGEPYSRQDMDDLLTNHQYLGPYINQASTYTTWTMADATHDEYLNDRNVATLAEMIKDVNRGFKAADALEDAAGKISTILSNFSAAQ